MHAHACEDAIWTHRNADGDNDYGKEDSSDDGKGDGSDDGKGNDDDDHKNILCMRVLVKMQIWCKVESVAMTQATQVLNGVVMKVMMIMMTIVMIMMMMIMLILMLMVQIRMRERFNEKEWIEKKKKNYGQTPTPV